VVFKQLGHIQLLKTCLVVVGTEYYSLQQ